MNAVIFKQLRNVKKAAPFRCTKNILLFFYHLKLRQIQVEITQSESQLQKLRDGYKATAQAIESGGMTFGEGSQKLLIQFKEQKEVLQKMRRHIAERSEEGIEVCHNSMCDNRVVRRR